MSIADLRKEYTMHGLHESEVAPDPFRQFEVWFQAACQAQLPEPNAMTLATVSVTGRPAARIVLLKGFDAQGFVFFTNYASRKGQELQQQPFAALVFYWPELERQVRIEGRVEPTSAAESDAYFTSRPMGSRLGAWASPQSQVIASRDVIDERISALQAQFGGGEIPRPEHWGGFRLIPDCVEFWQGRPSRLHDRLRYQLNDAGWQIERLAP